MVAVPEIANATQLNETGITLSVVIPAYNSADLLGACLGALRSAVEAASCPVEIIVVDDGSTDDTARAAGAVGEEVIVVALPTNVGRGPARNAGAARATGSVLVFLDADVLVHRDALEKIAETYRADPGLVAVFGSYDDTPGELNIISQYRNLLHHYVHQTAGPVAQHFWTGLGAVRSDVFHQVGGFDEGRWARNMEEVEFGHRLVAAGHTIHARPDILGTHLKAFSLNSMVRVDLVQRAIPWSRLLLEKSLPGNTYVTSWSQKLSVLAAGALLLAILSWPFFGLPAQVAAKVAFAAFLIVNLDVWRFFIRKRGKYFALTCVPLHLVYAVCCGIGFVWSVLSVIGANVAYVLRGGWFLGPQRS